MTQPPAPQPSPKRALIELLGDKERYCAAHEAAALLFPGAALGVVRCVLFAAGMPSPRFTELGPFLAELVRMGWQVVPRALGLPEPGDIWVETNVVGRIPTRIGFVAKPNLGGTWFMKPDRERMDVAAIDFVLRLPGT